MESVMSGKLLDFFKNILNSVEKSFRELDYTIRDRKVDKDTGEFIYTIILNEDEAFKVRGVPTGKKDAKLFDLQFISDDKSGNMKKEVDDVPYDKLTTEIVNVAKWFFDRDSIQEVLDDETGKDIRKDLEKSSRSEQKKAQREAEEKAAEASKKLSIKLEKITSATSVDIALTAVKANYDPTEALADLEVILDPSTLEDLITDDVNNYEVIVNEDGYDCEPCENIDINLQDVITTMRVAGYNLYFNFYEFCKYNPMVDYRYKDWLYTISTQIDTLTELSIELTDGIPTVVETIKQLTPIPISSVEDAVPLIRTYVDTLNLQYCHFSHDIQEELDRMIRHWEHEINYMI